MSWKRTYQQYHKETRADRIERGVRALALPAIYQRGEAYLYADAVLEWYIVSTRVREMTAYGLIEGSDEYEAMICIDLSNDTISNTDCSCPYDDVCKHTVALGLKVVQLLRHFEDERTPTYDTDADNETFLGALFEYAKLYYAKHDTSFLPNAVSLQSQPEHTASHSMSTSALSAPFLDERQELIDTLTKLGIPTEVLSDDLVKQLVALRRTNATIRSHSDAPVPTQRKKRSTPKRFNPTKYLIYLDTQLTPSLRKRAHPYIEASVKEVLAYDGLTDTQRELLEGLRARIWDAYIPDRDLRHMAKLIQESDIPTTYDPYNVGKSSAMSFHTEETQKIRACIQHIPRDPDSSSSQCRFALVLASDYLPYQSYSRFGYSFVASADCVAHLAKNTVTFYPMPNELAQMISRADTTAFYRYGFTYSRHEEAPPQTYLTGDELWQYEEMVALAERHLALTAPLPEITRVDRATKEEALFEIEYHAKEKAITMRAMIDYGSMRQDVSESVYTSTAGGVKHLALRYSSPDRYAPQDTHRTYVEQGVLHIAPIAEEKEIAWYRTVSAHAEEIGFTKTLRAHYPGEKKVLRYLRDAWPALCAFAQEQEYPIVFTRDVIAYETASVQTEFSSITADDENDWLHFDVACYCGGARLTLKDVIDFVESGKTVFTRDDGTMVDISNREDLVRLVTLLNSFEARENGFRGKLYHAAELKYVLTSSEHYASERAKSFDRFVRHMERGKPVKPVRIPARFAKILRPYQKEGVYWMHFLRSFRFAGILADDMGLGKTLQAITLLAMNRTKGTPSIVVCPKTLIYNWKHEIERFAPELTTLVYEGTPAERKKLVKRFSSCEVVIISYNTLKKDEALLVRPSITFNYAILDEAQFIKNHATKSAQVAKRLNVAYRLALTGTPLENNVSEIWSVFDFCMPGFLGSYEHFAKHFHRPIMDAGDMRALKHLRKKVEPFMLRRTKAEVLKDLPPKVEQEVVCELGTTQSVLYQEILAQVKRDVFTAVEEKGFTKSHIHIFAGLMKLRQACNHPALLLDTKARHNEYESAKLELALELIGEAVAGNHKILVFSQFTGMLDIIAKELSALNIQHLYLSGKTRNRHTLVDQFNTDASIPVFLISLKAGGTGLNLTSADTVIIFDPWWNPSVEAQAADRAHRIGQTNPVHVYRLLTSGTIEEKIQTLKAKKKTLSDALIGESGDLFKKLTWDDVKELFQE